MILVVHCDACSFSKRFSTELCGRRFKCPKCKKGKLEVPAHPSGPRTRPDADAAPPSEGAENPDSKVFECKDCGTLVPLTKGQKRLKVCPDCKAEREFNESAIEADAPRKGARTPTMKASPSKSGFSIPSLLGGLFLGLILGYSAGSASIPASSTNTKNSGSNQPVVNDPPKVETPRVDPPKPQATKPDAPASETFETPTGRYRLAHAEDFDMESKVFTVLEVVDGDTLRLNELPEQPKIRLLGVDTPETKHVVKGVQFYGKEASAFTKKTLEGQKVIVHIDPKNQQGVFGRSLMYLELMDGRDFNAMLIEGGYARVTTEYPFNRQKDYEKVEAKAKAAGRGMWNEKARAEWEAHKKAEADALAAAEKAKENAEIAARQKLLDEAASLGGSFVRAKRSTTVHKAWCPRRPKKDIDYFPSEAAAVGSDGKKHSCCDEAP